MSWEALWDLSGVHPVDDLIRPFLPTYVTEVVVLYLVLRRRFEEPSGLCLRRPAPASDLWVLPLQVWSLQAALISVRRILFWQGGLLGPDPREPLLALSTSLLALVVVSSVQLAGVLLSAGRGLTLGLGARQFTAFGYGLAAIVLDVFVHQVVIGWF